MNALLSNAQEFHIKFGDNFTPDMQEELLRFNNQVKEIEEQINSGVKPAIHLKISMSPIIEDKKHCLGQFRQDFENFIQSHYSWITSLALELLIPEYDEGLPTYYDFQYEIVNYLKHLNQLQALYIYFDADLQNDSAQSYARFLASMFQSITQPEIIKLLRLRIYFLNYDHGFEEFERYMEPLCDLSAFSSLESLEVNLDISMVDDYHDAEELAFFPDFLKKMISSILFPEKIKQFHLNLGTSSIQQFYFFFMTDCYSYYEQDYIHEILCKKCDIDQALIETIKKMNNLIEIKIHGNYSIFFIDNLNLILKSLPHLNSLDIYFRHRGNYASVYEILENPKIQRLCLWLCSAIYFPVFDEYQSIVQSFIAEPDIYIRPYFSHQEIIDRLNLTTNKTNVIDLDLNLAFTTNRQYSENIHFNQEFMTTYFLNFLKLFNGLCLRSLSVIMPRRFCEFQPLDQVKDYLQSISPCTKVDINFGIAYKEQFKSVEDELFKISNNLPKLRDEFIYSASEEYKELSSANIEMLTLSDNLKDAHLKDIKLFFYICTVLHQIRDLKPKLVLHGFFEDTQDLKQHQRLNARDYNILIHFCSGVFDQMIFDRFSLKRNYSGIGLEILKYLSLRDIKHLVQAKGSIYHYYFSTYHPRESQARETEVLESLPW